MTEATALIDDLEEGRKPTKAEVYLLARLEPGRELDYLLAAAGRVRDRYYGREIHLRALIEFSNHCRRDCRYCGLKAGNAKLARYRLTPEEILAAAEEARRAGYGTVVLQSGEDPWYSRAMLAELIRELKRDRSLAVTLSLGERPFEDYRAFRQAGADRYLLKHETANRELYRRLRPGQAPGERWRVYRWLRDLGYQVGGGFMIGLPGWNARALTDNLWLLRALKPAMAGLGPFLPHPDTELSGAEPGQALETLKAVALARLMMPKALLPATTALETLAPGFRLAALKAGANVVMPKATPPAYRALYNIYPRLDQGLDLKEQKRLLNQEATAAGFTLAPGRGDSLATDC